MEVGQTKSMVWRKEEVEKGEAVKVSRLHHSDAEHPGGRKPMSNPNNFAT